MAENNTADIGFEKEIWDAACVLRGNLDASEYKNIILGLIFLKYISDSFEKKHQALVNEGEGFEEDRDEYTSENIFFVPQGARWDDIAAVAHKPEIGIAIDAAMAAIENENPKLKNILPKNFSRPDLDKRRLGDVVDLFKNIKMTEGTDEKDLLGRTYEYCLRNFAEQEGKNAGQFYTPSCVVRTIVEVLRPFNGRVYDPCCGSGGMFVQSAAFVKNHQGNINNISVYGQESNPTTWKMAKMNLAIRGIDCNLGEIPEDTFLNDQHPTMRADYIMANPPFNLTPWGADKLKEDQRWKFGMPPASNANYAWIQHMLWHLAPEGKMGVILANTALSIATGEEYEIRKKIIEANYIDAIVSLPAQLFYSTKIKVSIWFLNKNKNSTDILFVDAQNLGHMVSRTLKEFSEEDIDSIANAVHDFQNGNNKLDIVGFCKVATLEEVKEKNYNISPSKYVVGSLDVDDIGDYSEELENDLQKLSAYKERIKNAKQFTSYREKSLTTEYLTLLNEIYNLQPAEAHSLLLESEAVINALFEASELCQSMADRLFKHWFVVYNFPTVSGKEYKDAGGELKETPYGQIPAHWDIITFDSILQPSNERVGERDNIPEYSTTNQGIFPRASKFNKALTKNSNNNKIIVRGDIVFGMSREIFNFGVMKDPIGAVSPAYHVYHIDGTKMNSEFLEIYMRICSDYFLSLIKPGAREGQVLDKEELARKLILCPPLDLQEKYMLIRKQFVNWLL